MNDEEIDVTAPVEFKADGNIIIEGPMHVDYMEMQPEDPRYGLLAVTAAFGAGVLLGATLLALLWTHLPGAG